MEVRCVSKPKDRIVMAVFLVTSVCMLGLPACGGAAPATPPTTTSEDGQVGKSLQSTGWAVTLIDQPVLTKQIGTGTANTYSDWGDVGHRLAEGIWLISSIEVTNSSGEMAFLPKNLLKVRDAQGREYAASTRSVHGIHVWSEDRWGKEQNQLVQNPIATGETREGPLIFDVAEDAKSLELTMGGTEDTIDLGF